MSSLAYLFGMLNLIAILLLVNGCSPTYLMRAGWGQARILWTRTPLEKLLQEGSLSPEEEAKIRLILRVKLYAQEELGLKIDNNYTDFVRIKGKELAYALSACPRDKLEPYRWWFPIVGSMPYLGFFSKKSAMKEKDRLEEQGYDTYLRGVAAYSTLGWFRDPIFSTMLSNGEVQLVDIIVHEILHNTVFVKDQMDFNESLATFVGQQGAIEFFCAGEGEGLPHCNSAKALAHDDFLLSAVIERLYERLHALYSSSLSRSEILKRREKVFRQAAEEFQKNRGDFLTDSYRLIDREPLNNATILAFRTYHHHLLFYQKVFKRLDRNLRQTIDLFRYAAHSQPDPLAWAASWLGEIE